jgi:hypothetical protein
LAERKRLAVLMRGLGAPTVVMEEEKSNERENAARKFMRLIGEAQVKRFVLFWPLGTKPWGLDVEVGHLLTRIIDGELSVEDVVIVARRVAIPTYEEEKGRVYYGLEQKGQRTWYFGSLIDEGCPSRPWTEGAVDQIFVDVALSFMHTHMQVPQSDLADILDARKKKARMAPSAK